MEVWGEGGADEEAVATDRDVQEGVFLKLLTDAGFFQTGAVGQREGEAGNLIGRDGRTGWGGLASTGTG